MTDITYAAFLVTKCLLHEAPLPPPETKALIDAGHDVCALALDCVQYRARECGENVVFTVH